MYAIIIYTELSDFTKEAAPTLSLLPVWHSRLRPGSRTIACKSSPPKLLCTEAFHYNFTTTFIAITYYFYVVTFVVSLN